MLVTELAELTELDEFSKEAKKQSGAICF